MMTCQLEVRCSNTSFGQQLGIVGACPDFGCWNPGRALRLHTCQDIFPVWAGDVPKSIIGCEFKFVILGPAGSVTWETLPNRVWSLAGVGSALDSSVLTTSYDDEELRLRLVEHVLASPVSSPSATESTLSPVVRVPRYTFKPTVSCFEVPDLQDLEEEFKKHLWWSSKDFAEFLKVRMAITKAYDEAVKSDRAASFSGEPIMRNESRRGLGLGRSKVRLNNTHKHIRAVLDEQERQRGMLVYDYESLAEVSRAVSSTDLAYSMKNAETDAEEARQYMEEETEQKSPANDARSHTPLSFRTMRRVDSFGLFQPETDPDFSSGTTSLSVSKGFGISREELEQVGLLATGRRDEGPKE